MSLYDSYDSFKAYSTPTLGAKHMARFDAEFWLPAGCRAEMAVLEVGCGTGLFLAFLDARGVGDFLGIDLDPKLADVVPKNVRDRFLAVDVREFLAQGAGGRRFDRIALFDVLEHFTADEGLELLRGLGGILRPGGLIVVKLPNNASPWGGQFQYGDLTHRTAYTPSSLRQLAGAAGLRVSLVYPHLLGSPPRRFFDRVLHGLLGRMLMTPPEIWTANFLAVVGKPEETSAAL